MNWKILSINQVQTVFQDFDIHKNGNPNEDHLKTKNWITQYDWIYNPILMKIFLLIQKFDSALIFCPMMWTIEIKDIREYYWKCKRNFRTF